MDITQTAAIQQGNLCKYNYSTCPLALWGAYVLHYNIDYACKSFYIQWWHVQCVCLQCISILQWPLTLCASENLEWLKSFPVAWNFVWHYINKPVYFVILVLDMKMKQLELLPEGAVSQWEDLGYQLDFTADQLDIISSNHNEKAVVTCRKEMASTV